MGSRDVAELGHSQGSRFREALLCSRLIDSDSTLALSVRCFFVRLSEGVAMSDSPWRRMVQWGWSLLAGRASKPTRSLVSWNTQRRRRSGRANAHPSAALESRVLLTNTLPTIDSLAFTNPTASNGSANGNFVGSLTDNTPGSNYTIEIDTNSDQMSDVSGMTGGPGSYSVSGSMPIGTTSVKARAIECDSATGQYEYGSWQTFTVSDGFVVNTLPTIAALTFANQSASNGSVNGNFEGSVTDATPSSYYTIEIDTSGDQISDVSGGAYNLSFNFSSWIAIGTTSVKARAIEYDSATGQYVASNWQTFTVSDGVAANTLPTITTLEFMNPSASNGSVSGAFAGSLTNTTTSSSYTIDIDTNGDQMPDASGMSSGPGNFSLSGSMPIGTTSVRARAIGYDSATGQYAYGGWQTFTVSDGIVVNTLPTIASLTFSNPSASYGTVSGSFTGSFGDTTPSSSYTIEVDTNGDQMPDVSGMTGGPGSFSVSGSMSIGTTSVWARAIESVNVTGQSAYGSWQTFAVSGSGGGNGAGSGSGSGNSVPVALGDGYSVFHDTELHGTGSGSGSGMASGAITYVYGVMNNDHDDDGDTTTAELVSDVQHGSLVLNTDGTFEYTPDSHWAGIDQFTYRITDGVAWSNVVTAVISVWNTVPNAQNEGYQIDHGHVLVTSNLGGGAGGGIGGFVANGPVSVLENDQEYDNEPLEAVLVTDVQNGTLVLNADGTFVYTPNQGFAGTDTFTYHATDGVDNSLATVTIEVLNMTPLGTNDTYFTLFDNPITVSPVGNDHDGDGDALSVGIITQPIRGTVSVNGSLVTYTPSTVANLNGETVTFTYKPLDGFANSSTIGAVTVTIYVKRSVTTPERDIATVLPNDTDVGMLTQVEINGIAPAINASADPDVVAAKNEQDLAKTQADTDWDAGEESKAQILDNLLELAAESYEQAVSLADETYKQRLDASYTAFVDQVTPLRNTARAAVEAAKQSLRSAVEQFLLSLPTGGFGNGSIPDPSVRNSTEYLALLTQIRQLQIAKEIDMKAADIRYTTQTDDAGSEYASDVENNVVGPYFGTSIDNANTYAEDVIEEDDNESATVESETNTVIGSLHDVDLQLHGDIETAHSTYLGQAQLAKTTAESGIDDVVDQQATTAETAYESYFGSLNSYNDKALNAVGLVERERAFRVSLAKVELEILKKELTSTRSFVQTEQGAMVDMAVDVAEGSHSATGLAADLEKLFSIEMLRAISAANEAESRAAAKLEKDQAGVRESVADSVLMANSEYGQDILYAQSGHESDNSWEQQELIVGQLQAVRQFLQYGSNTTGVNATVAQVDSMISLVQAAFAQASSQAFAALSFSGQYDTAAVQMSGRDNSAAKSYAVNLADAALDGELSTNSATKSYLQSIFQLDRDWVETATSKDVAYALAVANLIKQVHVAAVEELQNAVDVKQAHIDALLRNPLPDGSYASELVYHAVNEPTAVLNRSRFNIEAVEEAFQPTDPPAPPEDSAPTDDPPPAPDVQKYIYSEITLRDFSPPKRYVDGEIVIDKNSLEDPADDVTVGTVRTTLAGQKWVERTVDGDIWYHDLPGVQGYMDAATDSVVWDAYFVNAGSTSLPGHGYVHDQHIEAIGMDVNGNSALLHVGWIYIDRNGNAWVKRAWVPYSDQNGNPVAGPHIWKFVPADTVMNKINSGTTTSWIDYDWDRFFNHPSSNGVDDGPLSGGSSGGVAPTSLFDWLPSGFVRAFGGQAGSTSDTIINGIDSFNAGIADTVSGGLTTRLRGNIYGEIATRNHEGGIFLAGQIVGIAPALAVGIYSGATAGHVGRTLTAARYLNVTTTVYGAVHVVERGLNGESLGIGDAFAILPVASFGLSRAFKWVQCFEGDTAVATDWSSTPNDVLALWSEPLPPTSSLTTSDSFAWVASGIVALGVWLAMEQASHESSVGRRRRRRTATRPIRWGGQVAFS